MLFFCIFVTLFVISLLTGKALELPHLETPTDDEVEKYHDQYVKVSISLSVLVTVFTIGSLPRKLYFIDLLHDQAVQELFERNKKLYGDPSSKLELF